MNANITKTSAAVPPFARWRIREPIAALIVDSRCLIGALNDATYGHFITRIVAPTFVPEFANALELLARLTAQLRYFLLAHSHAVRDRNRAADAIRTIAALIRRPSAPCRPPPELLRLAADLTTEPVQNLDAFACAAAALLSCCRAYAPALAPLGLGPRDVAALETALRRLEAAHCAAGAARDRRARLAHAQLLVAGPLRESCAHVRKLADLTFPAHQIPDDPTIADARRLFGLDVPR